MSPLIRTSSPPSPLRPPIQSTFTRRRRRRRRRPIHEELHKNAQIQKQRAQTPDQPTRIDEHIPPIKRRLLPRPTLHRPPAFRRRVGENAHDVRQVPDAGEEEKQQGHALGALAAPVEQDLRHARAEVEGRAQVAEELAPDVEAEGGGVAGVLGVGVGVVAGGVPAAEPPAEGAGSADEDDGDAVEEDRLCGRGRGQVVGSGRVGGCGRGEERGGGREVRAVDAGQVVAEGGGGAGAVVVVVRCAVVGVAVGVAVGSGEEGFVFGRVVVVVDEGFRGRIGEGEAAVVEALAEQDDVGERVVDGKDDHGR